jgi:hypothetical protein
MARRSNSKPKPLFVFHHAPDLLCSPCPPPFCTEFRLLRVPPVLHSAARLRSSRIDSFPAAVRIRNGLPSHRSCPTLPRQATTSHPSPPSPAGSSFFAESRPVSVSISLSPTEHCYPGMHPSYRYTCTRVVPRIPAGPNLPSGWYSPGG